MEPIRLAATFTLVSTWDVELIPTEGQYEVYYQNSWSADEWTYWGDIKQPLDVREAAAALSNLYDDGLSGDWLSKISVTGVNGWRADVLRMAAITSDSPCGEHLEFLLQLSDADLEWIWSRNESLVTDSGLALVKCLIHLFGDDYSSSDPIDLDRLLEQVGLNRDADANAIHAVDEIRREEERAAIERAAKPFEAEIDRIMSAFSKAHGSQCTAVRLGAVENALKKFVADHGCLPEDEMQVPNECIVNVRLLRYATVEEFIQQRAPTDPISVEMLSCCTNFPPPSNPVVVERLLRAWAMSSEKPTARQLFGLGWRTPLGFLPWALGGVATEVTVQIADAITDEWKLICRCLEEHVNLIESEVSAERRPSSQATAMRNSAKTAFVNWARRLLESSMHLSGKNGSRVASEEVASQVPLSRH